MRILGIDPGSTSMGFALLTQEAGNLKLITHGSTAIKLKELPAKLARLHEILTKLIKEQKPDAAGVEKLFFSKNKKTALEVAHARGVILLTLLEHKVPLYEFTPGEVKIAVTNYGAADKTMVASMAAKILKLPSLAGDDNAADAVAVAIATANECNRKY
jgi:crossover junction endodeoxyribonuclease RuvC